jgi:hypothetical protein
VFAFTALLKDFLNHLQWIHRNGLCLIGENAAGQDEFIGQPAVFSIAPHESDSIVFFLFVILAFVDNRGEHGHLIFRTDLLDLPDQRLQFVMEDCLVVETWYWGDFRFHKIDSLGFDGLLLSDGSL